MTSFASLRSSRAARRSTFRSRASRIGSRSDFSWFTRSSMESNTELNSNSHLHKLVSKHLILMVGTTQQWLATAKNNHDDLEVITNVCNRGAPDRQAVG